MYTYIHTYINEEYNFAHVCKQVFWITILEWILTVYNEMFSLLRVNTFANIVDYNIFWSYFIFDVCVSKIKSLLIFFKDSQFNKYLHKQESLKCC